MWTFIREYLENEVQFLLVNSTFRMQFSLLVRNLCRDDGDKAKFAHCTSFLAYLHHNSHFREFWHFFCTAGPGFRQLSWESVLDVVRTTRMGLPSHCFFKGFKIPFWKKPTTADHYKDQNPAINLITNLIIWNFGTLWYHSLNYDIIVWTMIS